MNTREMAAEYRLAHWAGIMNERKESGLSVKAFCENAGIHGNTYFYWQKKLREMACGVLAGTTMLAPQGFAEVKLAAQPMLPVPAATMQNQISIESSGVRITACGEYPADKLAALLREVMRPC